MMNVIEIKSLDTPELAPYAKLTEAQLRSRQRPEAGMFIAEGVKVCEYALAAGFEPVSFLVERKHIEGKARALLSGCGETPVYTAEREVLAALTGFELTRGVLCAMRRKPLPSAAQVCEGASRLAVLEGLVDPSNVGAVFRSASALGVDGLLLCPDCCDPLYRKAIRAGMGSVFTLPWCFLEEYMCSAEGGVPGLLRRYGFVSAALALDERAISLDAPVLKEAGKLALFLGSEGNGLKAGTVAACDHTVIIPMSHGMDSLNVAAAASVAFWELRKR